MMRDRPKHAGGCRGIEPCSPRQDLFRSSNSRLEMSRLVVNKMEHESDLKISGLIVELRTV
jgi:hypothetical protein